jgi:hypothetical protein
MNSAYPEKISRFSECRYRIAGLRRDTGDLRIVTVARLEEAVGKADRRELP